MLYNEVDMANETPHSILGFAVQFDGLIQEGTIHVNPLDWDALSNAIIAAPAINDSPELPAEQDTGRLATSYWPIPASTDTEDQSVEHKDGE